MFEKKAAFGSMIAGNKAITTHKKMYIFFKIWFMHPLYRLAIAVVSKLSKSGRFYRSSGMMKRWRCTAKHFKVYHLEDRAVPLNGLTIFTGIKTYCYNAVRSPLLYHRTWSAPAY